MIRDPWLRALVGVMCAIAGIYLVGLLWQVVQQFADILLLFFLAWLIAFILEPVVGVLIQRTRLPRLPAIALTYLLLLFVLSAGVVLLVPALTSQVVQVARNLPSYAEQVTGWVTEWQASTNEWLLDRRSPLLVDLNSALNADELARRIEALGPPLLNNVVAWAAGAAVFLVELLLVLVLSFYFMTDGARLADRLLGALPQRARDDARFLIASIHVAFAGFLRGQLIQALVSGIFTGVIMATLGLEYALLASFIAGLVLLIPFVGPVVALWVPVMIAVFTKPEVAPLLLVVLLLLQQVIFNVVGPRVMSQQVGLHPLMVIFAFLVGARLAGVWGAVFGVPVLAVLLTMASFYRASREEQLVRIQQRLADPPPDPAGEPLAAESATIQRREAHST